MRKGERLGRRKLCLCGEYFYCIPCREARKKYCSKKCMYAFRPRRSGLTYNIKVINRGWIRPGQRLAPNSEFKRGQVPNNFKGDSVGYYSLHDWVRRHAGVPQVCVRCGGTKKVQWANKSWEYKRDLSDWLPLCYWCHRKYDRPAWGEASRQFPEIRK